MPVSETEPDDLTPNADDDDDAEPSENGAQDAETDE